jgi:signal peptidase
LKLHVDSKTGKEFILTKGDNNPVNDRGLFGKGMLWLERKHITGKVKGYFPYVGMIPTILNDYPKYSLVLFLYWLFVLIILDITHTG